MKSLLYRTAPMLILALVAGCTSSTSDDSGATDAAAPPPAVPEAHGHSHGDDADALTWVKKDVVHDDYKINLGLHGPHLHAGESAEVAVEISKAEEAVADAKVFVTLLDDAGETVLVEEQATVYEPATDEEGAHYAQAELAVPADARRVIVRYRIEFPDADEFSSDVLMKTE